MEYPPFITGQPVVVRLAQDTAGALKMTGETEMYSASIIDGWLVASQKVEGGGVTKYLLPPQSFLYVKQFQPDSGASPPGVG